MKRITEIVLCLEFHNYDPSPSDGPVSVQEADDVTMSGAGHDSKGAGHDSRAHRVGSAASTHNHVGEDLTNRSRDGSDMGTKVGDGHGR